MQNFGSRLERLESVVSGLHECLTLSVLSDTLVDLGDEPVEQSGAERRGGESLLFRLNDVELLVSVPVTMVRVLSALASRSASIIMTATASLRCPRRIIRELAAVVGVF